MNERDNNRTTLVLGGTGKTGRRVVARLNELGLPVRVGSRAGAPPFDWDRPSTWSAVLDAVDAVYVSFHPDLAVPGAPEVVRSFAELAADRGVNRVVLLSGRGESEAQRAEQVVRDTGVDLTVVRCAWFMQNFSESFMLDAVMEGTIALPGADGEEPFVDADDIADVAVAALTEDGHGDQVYELTGPRLLTWSDVAEELSAATGRQVSYVEVSVDEYAAAAASQGVPQSSISFLTYLFGEVYGRNPSLHDGVRRALGREARDFKEYASAAAAAGAWRGSSVG